MKALVALGIVVPLMLVSSSSISQSERAKTIVVDTERQKLYAYVGDTEVYEFDCVTGKTGKETVPGHFAIIKKVPDYFSHTYKTPMPYSLFFSDDGKAIHQTSKAMLRSYLMYVGVNSVGSHGCVGLSEENARTIYSWASIGTTVEIIKGVSGTWKGEATQVYRGREIRFTYVSELKQDGTDVSGFSRSTANTTPNAHAVFKLKGTFDGHVLSIRSTSIIEQTPIPIPNAFWCPTSSELRFAVKDKVLALIGPSAGCGYSATVVMEKIADQ